MRQVERITAEAREDILVQALLTCPNLTEVSRKTNIPRPTIYTVINTDSFRKKYTEARDKAVTTAIAYLQGKRANVQQFWLIQPQIRKYSPRSE